jgi:hypothetical protein
MDFEAKHYPSRKTFGKNRTAHLCSSDDSLMEKKKTSSATLVQM